jgi:hypothetical protein
MDLNVSYTGHTPSNFKSGVKQIWHELWPAGHKLIYCLNNEIAVEKKSS